MKINPDGDMEVPISDGLAAEIAAGEYGLKLMTRALRVIELGLSLRGGVGFGASPAAATPFDTVYSAACDYLASAFSGETPGGEGPGEATDEGDDRLAE